MKEIETWLIMSVVYCWAIKGRAIAESKDESLTVLHTICQCKIVISNGLIAVNISRAPGTNVLNPFLQTFGKIELNICTIKTIFFFTTNTIVITLYC